MMLLSSEFDFEKAKLEKLIVKTKAFQYSKEKPFLLASGRTSPFYFDLKKLNGDPEGINTVAKVFYHMIKTMKDVKSVGGLESGSISIATAISQLSCIENEKDPKNPLISSFYVRKEAKKYGSEKQIEGCITSPVVIVDDVITSGMSALKAVDIVKQEKFDCRCLISIVFRGSDENLEKIKSNNKFEYIFHENDFVKKFQENSNIVNQIV